VDSVALSDAAEQGTFNIGDARCRLRQPQPGSDGACTIDFLVPAGTAVGVWANAFPHELRPEAVDLVRATATDPRQLHELAPAVELKGTAGIQRVPLTTGPDGYVTEAPVDWRSV
jgi:hypothetical protein